MRKPGLLRIGGFAIAFALFCLVADHAFAADGAELLNGSWKCKVGNQKGVWEFKVAEDQTGGTIITKVTASKPKMTPQDLTTNFTITKADAQQVAYETKPDPKHGPIQFVAKFSGDDKVAISQAAYPDMYPLVCERQK